MQLFEYSRVFPDAAERRGEQRPPAPGVLENFKEGKPKTYPSTLRVRVTATRRPDRVKVTHRPQHVLQREVGEQTYEQMMKSGKDDRRDEPVLSRQSTQKGRKWRSGKQAHIPQTLQSTLSISSRYGFPIEYVIHAASPLTLIAVDQVWSLDDVVLERWLVGCGRVRMPRWQIWHPVSTISQVGSATVFFDQNHTLTLLSAAEFSTQTPAENALWGRSSAFLTPTAVSFTRLRGLPTIRSSSRPQLTTL